ncbi:hypothetical protein BBJ29_009110 [Phytophthora kernoviae]|uniref:Uncharacterized protein n=1 Tax=Phytophthora kernoviae TaxID=325452 RepID=A0A3F2RFM1_9STRA|nr:hypothetical protein BBJ29_009110 [Phytophthora kernoviae]RLN55378.1 hypothetical protein BBP00_00008516 [Phytophthora kernoviae]
MGRGHKKDDCAEEWDIVEETQDFDVIPPLFELVAETQDSVAIPLPFETVSKTQDSDAEVDAVTDALSQLPPPSQEPLDPPTYRIKEMTKEINSSVICKLTRRCRLTLLVEEIKKVCVVIKKVQLEGWHLANLHVLRCLKEGDEVPKLEQMFFYRCCTATLGNIVKCDRGSTESKYSAFHKTCLRYWAGRKRESAYDPEFIQNAGDMVNEMAKLMEINALNMIALHFRWRLHQYIRFQYAKKGDTELEYRETRKLVDSCYRVRSAPEKDDDGIPTGKTVKVWTELGDTDDPIEQELREWLGSVPWQWQIRANCAHFLHKLYNMLAWMEKVVDKHPKTKGARLYSRLPVATTFQAACVKLNASTLHGLLARLIDLPEVENFLKKELNIVRARKRTGSQLPFNKKTFQKNRSEVTRKVFNVERFETCNRAIRAMPSFKTSSYDLYFQRLQFFWKYLRFLLAFSTEQAFLRWRFTQDRAKMKALDSLVKRLVSKASKQVCIAYGDWSRRTGIKGHASGPVKGFAKSLKR